MSPLAWAPKYTDIRCSCGIVGVYILSLLVPHTGTLSSPSIAWHLQSRIILCQEIKSVNRNKQSCVVDTASLGWFDDQSSEAWNGARVSAGKNNDLACFCMIAVFWGMCRSRKWRNKTWWHTDCLLRKCKWKMLYPWLVLAAWWKQATTLRILRCKILSITLTESQQ